MSTKNSLYNKYRPKNFDQVVGQSVAKNILVNSISLNKINHAYIFYGIRGTGKTTLARIFAKSINCPNFLNHNPCNTCDSCKAIDSSSSFDIIEIDAASNNGVDEIRQIKENASYLTTESKYKVYIIDEVHMLTRQAFNALLKTLEEPPRNTIFILATTDLQKIPATVISRAILINFESISDKDVKLGIKNILNNENISFDERSLDYLSLVSEGSLRDAISSLEAVLLYNQNLSLENVIDSLGLVEKDSLINLIQNNIYALIDEISSSNKDIRKIAIVLSEILMDLIKQGNKEYIKLLNDIIFYLNKIQDPALFKISFKSSLLNFSNNNVSRETESMSEENNKVVKEKESPKQEVYPKEMIHSRKSNDLKEDINDKELSINNSKENINNVSRETQDKSKLNNFKKINRYALNLITDFINHHNYLYIMKNDSKNNTNEIINKWKYFNNYILDKEYKEIAFLLTKSRPLVSSNKTIVAIFDYENHINDFKRLSLKPSTLEFIKKILGEYKFILPINADNWKKLSAKKNSYEIRKDQVDIEIDFSQFIYKQNNNSEKDLLNVFDKENITK